MVQTAVVGGGPAGLSAALFTAKNGLDTVVFDTDETALHAAHLFNYPGIESIGGEEFLDVVRRQVGDHGGELRREAVTAVERTDSGFVVRTEDEEYTAKYLVLATGQARDLADSLGCAFSDDGTVEVDSDARTTVENVYAAGWIARKDKIQTAISVGMGAAAGLDVLSDHFGQPFRDFDTPEQAE